MSTETRNIFASIATYNEISLNTATWFISTTFKHIFQPHIEKDGVEFTLRCKKATSQNISSLPLDNVDWSLLGDESPLLWIMLSGWRERNRNFGKNPAIAGATLHFSQASDHISTIETSVNMEVIGGIVGRSIQANLVELMLSLFNKTNGTVGYITVDYVSANVYGSVSPYERAMGLSYPSASRNFRSKVRGYYWGNLLHKNHLDLLGGRSALSSAPVYLVRAIGDNQYYLQLSDNINNIEREELAQLKDFLSPVLPEGYPQPDEYYQSLPDFLL